MAVNQVKRNGSYAPLSARYYQDDAIANAGERAELLYVRSLAFCASQLNDGFITDTQVRLFVAPGMKGVQARADRLVEFGLWQRVEEDLLGTGYGYRVTAWLKHNLSKSDIESKQKRDAERKARDAK